MNPGADVGILEVSVHRVELGDGSRVPDREEQLLWDRHRRIELKYILTQLGQ
jgi:hypothetical protein